MYTQFIVYKPITDIVEVLVNCFLIWVTLILKEQAWIICI